mmetsp:Transcript_42205/g.109447  ORF Transcript_42205/g.109447 Transcript_42205/m.109447 type:complete len:246 (+) Transcript_42205:1489-2226(+)
MPDIERLWRRPVTEGARLPAKLGARLPVQLIVCSAVSRSIFISILCSLASCAFRSASSSLFCSCDRLKCSSATAGWASSKLKVTTSTGTIAPRLCGCECRHGWPCGSAIPFFHLSKNSSSRADLRAWLADRIRLRRSECPVKPLPGLTERLALSWTGPLSARFCVLPLFRSVSVVPPGFQALPWRGRLGEAEAGRGRDGLRVAMGAEGSWEDRTGCGEMRSAIPGLRRAWPRGLPRGDASLGVAS